MQRPRQAKVGIDSQSRINDNLALLRAKQEEDRRKELDQRLQNKKEFVVKLIQTATDKKSITNQLFPGQQALHTNLDDDRDYTEDGKRINQIYYPH